MLRSCGVYEIRNTINGHRYIGSSVDIERRWKSHVRKLNNNKHENNILIRAWNKYGKKSFEFNILAHCPKESLLNFEQIFLNEESCEYNIANCARAPLLGLTHSKETRRKLSEMNIGNQHWLGKHHSEKTKGKISNSLMGHKVTKETRKKLSEYRHTAEAKIKMSLARKGKPSPMLGKKHTEEAKKKMGIANIGNKYCLGNKLSEEHKRKISETLKGNVLSKETKLKIGLANKGRKMSKESIEKRTATRLKNNGGFYMKRKEVRHD